MTDFPFHYKGIVTLTDGTHSVELANVELWEQQEVVQFGAEVVPLGSYSWHGVGESSGIARRLLDMLGGEVGVRLADGRRGTAHVTGYCEESMWIIEITGAGPTPNGGRVDAEYK